MQRVRRHRRGGRRVQGKHEVCAIDEHVSEDTGFECRGARYVDHHAADGAPKPPRVCRSCRRPVTAGTAAMQVTRQPWTLAALRAWVRNGRITEERAAQLRAVTPDDAPHNNEEGLSE